MYARRELVRAGGGAGPRPRRSSSTLSPGAASVLDLQRRVGNTATTAGLSGGSGAGPLPVQRAYGNEPGTYAYRNRDRRRLEDEYDEEIDGNRTHQAEHPILFSAAAPRSRTGVRRRQAGQAGADVRYVEDRLPAYYEGYRDHRDHDGTGRRRRDRRGTTGYTQEEYRNAQTEALEEWDNPATAMHMNMVGYANQPNFRNPRRTAAVEQSDDSYRYMLSRGSGRAPYFDAGGRVRTTRPLMAYERAELDAGRSVARGGGYPDLTEQDRIMRSYGARSYRLRSERHTDFDELRDFPDLGSDRSESPRPLDTSYYREPSRSRARSRSRAPMSQREQLRTLARGGTLAEDDFATSFGGGYDDEDRGRSRARSRSRAAGRSRSRAVPSYLDLGDDAYSYLDDDGADLGRSRSTRRSGRSRSRARYY